MSDESSISRRRHAPKGPLKTRQAQTPMEGARPMDDRQCTARSKQSGVRCKRIAIPGGHLCYMHGGANPVVKQKALERLERLQNPAIDRLAKLIDQDQFPSVSYAASRDVLDRTLGKAPEAVKVEHSGGVELSWKEQ